MDRVDATVPQFLAWEPQYVHHLGAIWRALAAAGVDAGAWYGTEASRATWADVGAHARPWPGSLSAPIVVASAQDLARARRGGATRIARTEHGCGQSYGGDRRMARHPAYAGGDGHEGVSLILAPNEHSAARWSARYPSVPVRVVGSARVLTPPEDPGRPCLAVSFHWPGAMPELASALPHYRSSLASLAALPVIGTSHPRYERTARRAFGMAGIEWVPDIDEVARRATVFAVDNSSTLWEMGLHRPVIAMDAPSYRIDVHHGLRFWSHVPGSRVADGAELERLARRLLERGETPAEADRRRAIVAEVLGPMDGGAEAARLIAGWASEG